MRKKLINLADRLDSFGLFKEANYIDRLIAVASTDPDSETEEVTVPDELVNPSHPWSILSREQKLKALTEYNDDRRSNPNARFPYTDLDSTPVEPHPALLEAQKTERERARAEYERSRAEEHERGQVISIDTDAIQKDIDNAREALSVKATTYSTMASNALANLKSKVSRGDLSEYEFENYKDILNAVKYSFMSLESKGKGFSAARTRNYLMYGPGGPFDNSKSNFYMRNKEMFLEGLIEAFELFDGNRTFGEEIAEQLASYIDVERYDDKNAKVRMFDKYKPAEY